MQEIREIFPDPFCPFPRGFGQEFSGEGITCQGTFDRDIWQGMSRETRRALHLPQKGGKGIGRPARDPGDRDLDLPQMNARRGCREPLRTGLFPPRA